MNLKSTAALMMFGFLSATTALAAPSAVCIKMPAKITPLFKGGEIRNRVFSMCIDTNDWKESSTYSGFTPVHLFVRLFGAGGFEAKAAYHGRTPVLSWASQDPKNTSFNFRNLSGTWESIFATFLAASLRNEQIVSVAVGPLPSHLMQLDGQAQFGPRNNSARVYFGKEDRDSFGSTLSATAFDASGKQYDIFIGDGGSVDHPKNTFEVIEN